MKTYPLDCYLFISFIIYVYLRKINRRKDGKDHHYWALVESRRTARGPRQHLIAHLGETDEDNRLGIKMSAEGFKDYQTDLFEVRKPQWIEVDLQAVRTERSVDFGDIWLALELLKRLGLPELLHQVMPKGREKIACADLALILIIARFCHPKSELYIAEHFYQHTALPYLLGIPDAEVYDNRLYRTLDKLLPHKKEIEKHLKDRFGELFDIKYDLLLYDITSTYFEGAAGKNSQAKRGYSRDQRPDCKQICIALVVTKEGIPLGYEIFDGNRQDVTTVEEIVEKIEKQYGAVDRIWVMDRGMASEKNIRFLQQSKRRYIIGAPKSLLKKFASQLRSQPWQKIREGLEVQYCPSDAEQESFVICRSSARKEKEQAIFERFKKNIEDGLLKLKTACENGRLATLSVAERRRGRLLQANNRAAKEFDIQVKPNDQGKLELNCSYRQEQQDWLALSHGCYVLQTTVNDWSAEELWRAYMCLTDVEAAFRIHKSDFVMRPIWHQTKERVQAHILVCFLAFALWKCLAQICKQNGLGNEPRKILDEIKHIKLTDVILPTRKGVEIRLHCVSNPEPHQKILLHRLKLHIPSRLTENPKM